MDRTFTATDFGPTTLRLPVGTAHARVDPTAKTATIRLHTPDAEGPAVDAIRRASGSTGGGLSVTVPELEGGAGVVTVTRGGRSMSFSSFGPGTVTISGSKVTVNGRVVTGGSNGHTHTGITADITLPPGAGLTFHSASADLDVHGPLPGLNARTVSGDVTVGVVGVLRVTSTSGDIEATAVTEEIDAATISGDIEIGTYRGRHASLRSTSGDLALAATPAATGTLSATTVSGDVRLRGTAHLTPRTSSVSGRIRTA